MSPVVMFSIAGTLGSLTFPGGEVSKAHLEPYPTIVQLLRQVRDQGVSIGVEIPDERFDRASVAALLEAAGLLPLVDRARIQLAPFSIGASEGPAVFVGRDRFSRATAGRSFRTVPDPSLVQAALRGEAIYYVRAREQRRISRRTPRRESFSWLPIVEGIELAPLRVVVEAGHPVLYAVAGERAIGHLGEKVSVERLGASNLPERADLVLFQTALSRGLEAAAFLQRLQDLEFFLEIPGGGLAALDASQPAGAFHPPDDSHGHTLALLPSSTLILPSSTLISLGDDPPTLEGGTLDEAARNQLASLNGALLKQNLDPWIGSPPLDPACGGAIASRFLFHKHNPLAVTALACELKRILGNSATHEFTHHGARHNVYADLEGNGRAGELVIVGAHLDSTAARDGSCSLPADVGCVAPGADDDASGIAAVLSIASVLKQLADSAGAPERTIRFVLFNAEEQGMLGSEAYVKDLALKSDVRAMFQLDMIGTPRLGDPAPAPPRFEIHMGGFDDLGSTIYTVDYAQGKMADAIEQSAALLSPGLPAQRFPVAACDSDPGSNRSDHTRFQSQGLPACYVCEELWTHDCPDGKMRSHPTYHRAADTGIDVDYAAAIARAVAGAVWILANP